MTHDELLDELNYAVQEYDKAYDNTNYYYTALRSVVELHKPVEFIPEWKPRCNDCEIFYPCPTILAIEKELE